MSAPTGFGLGEQPLKAPVRTPVTVTTLLGRAAGNQIGAPYDGRVFVALNNGNSAWFATENVTMTGAPDGL